MKYSYVRWDPDFEKYAVTCETELIPEPIDIQKFNTYWFPTVESAVIFAKAQKYPVILSNYDTI